VSGLEAARGRSGQFRRLPRQRCDGGDRLWVTGVTVAATGARRSEDPTAPTRLQRYVSGVEDAGWPAAEAHLPGIDPHDPRRLMPCVQLVGQAAVRL